MLATHRAIGPEDRSCIFWMYFAATTADPNSSTLTAAMAKVSRLTIRGVMSESHRVETFAALANF
jgi:hypothetical protein